MISHFGMKTRLGAVGGLHMLELLAMRATPPAGCKDET